jgi:3-hydroxypropionyl-CoA synthetase (ADP-forming)
MTADRLSKETIRRIETILAAAEASGRDMLFEHEIYAVLRMLGLVVPVHAVVEQRREITAKLLAGFGSDQLVIKVAARAVAHKQRLGGVKVVYKDLEFVQYTCDDMRRTFESQGIPVNHLLLVEHVKYSESLGNENLLGFRESETFGPVLSISKGGSDAEYFAEHFSPPNLILAPIDRKWARALLESTHIHKKYLLEGKGDYIRRLVNAGVAFSDLALAFSNYFPAAQKFVFKEFEVNPFVFADDGRFLALDGYARFEKRRPRPVMSELQPGERMRPFFKPHGVAVVGVSTSNPSKLGNIIMTNLVKLQRPDVYGVNPKGGRVSIAGRDLPLYPSLQGIDHPVELVIVAVPADAVLAAVQDCARKGVRAVILIAGGFSEIDRNKDVEENLLALARQHQFRIIGPNCLGVVYAGDGRGKGINSFFVPEEKLSINLEGETRVALLSQSGALGFVELENLRTAISPKVIVSYGNQLDVDPCDLVAYLQDDPGVDVIGCYIEGFKPGAGRKFFNVAGRSRKPVIVYKAGRTEAGRKAARSHTAAMAGEYAVAKAAMKQAGLIVADTMIDHGDLIKTFALLNGCQVSGNRLAMIANAGYEKTSAADRLGDLVPAQLDEKTKAALAKVLPSIVLPDALLDLTPMADDAVFAVCIETLLRSETVDVLLISIVPHSALLNTTDKEIEENPDNIAARIIRLTRRYKKPTAASVTVTSRADAVFNKLIKTLDAGGVPTYLTAERAMFCLNAFVRHRLAQRAGRQVEMLR